MQSNELRDLKHDIKAINKSVKADTVDPRLPLKRYEKAIRAYEETGGSQQEARRALEMAAEGLDYLMENVERERAYSAAKNRTRAEWEALEAQHCQTPISHEDVFDTLMTAIEPVWYAFQMTPDGEARDRIRQKLEGMAMNVEEILERQCAYVFCRGAIVTADKRGNIRPGRANARFCCEAHRKAQYDAEQRFRETATRFAAGTYLPEDAYIPIRSKKREETLARQHAEQRHAGQVTVMNKFYGISAEDAA